MFAVHSWRLISVLLKDKPAGLWRERTPASQAESPASERNNTSVKFFTFEQKGTITLIPN